MMRHMNRLAEASQARRHERPRKTFRLPLGGAEHHHQTYISTKERKTLDTTPKESAALLWPFEATGQKMRVRFAEIVFP